MSFLLERLKCVILKYLATVQGRINMCSAAYWIFIFCINHFGYVGCAFHNGQFVILLYIIYCIYLYYIYMCVFSWQPFECEWPRHISLALKYDGSVLEQSTRNLKTKFNLSRLRYIQVNSTGRPVCVSSALLLLL